MAYHFLGALGGEEGVLELLFEGLSDYRVRPSCVDALIRIGPDAVPGLKVIAEKEKGYIRPATLALEKIEAARGAEQERRVEGTMMPTF
jgi:hypothetical protein